MASKDKSPRLAIGFRVKTGRAIAVVMAGPASAPRVLSRKSLQLWNPAIPESHQPFHAELELPPSDSARVVPLALKAVERVALSALRELVAEISLGPGSIVGIALVAGSATDPKSIRNPHMRAHTLAKASFSRTRSPRLQRQYAIPAITIVESEVFSSAASRLGKTTDAIKIAVAEFGRGIGKPWSAEEKAAAAAAWIALAN